MKNLYTRGARFDLFDRNDNHVGISRDWTLAKWQADYKGAAIFDNETGEWYNKLGEKIVRLSRIALFNLEAARG